MFQFNKLCFEELELFHAFFELQSFYAVAKIFKLPALVVKQKISNIEKVLSIDIFVEDYTGNIVFSQEAVRLKKILDHIKSEFDVLEHSLFQNKVLKSEIKIGMSISVALQLKKMIKLLKILLPECNISTHNHSNISTKNLCSFDLAIHVNDMYYKNHTTEHLNHIYYKFYTTAEYIKKNNLPYLVDQIPFYDFFVLNDQSILDSLFRENSIYFKNHNKFNNEFIVEKFIANNKGIGVLQTSVEKFYDNFIQAKIIPIYPLKTYITYNEEYYSSFYTYRLFVEVLKMYLIDVE